jgi:acyl dehydratase
MNPGEALPPFAIRVSQDSMAVWAGLLHDPNPLHLDPAAVRAKGLGDRTINQGPANLAYVVEALRAAFPEGEIVELDLRFLDNVFAGDLVEASGRVAAQQDTDGERCTRCDVRLQAAGREPALAGSAVVREHR